MGSLLIFGIGIVFGGILRQFIAEISRIMKGRKNLNHYKEERKQNQKIENAKSLKLETQNNRKSIICPICQGAKMVVNVLPNGQWSNPVPCPQCNGNGVIWE